MVIYVGIHHFVGPSVIVALVSVAESAIKLGITGGK
jgi:hypothetical protein